MSQQEQLNRKNQHRCPRCGKVITPQEYERIQTYSLCGECESDYQEQLQGGTQ